MKYLFFACLLSLSSFSLVAAQDARSQGMGGVLLPDRSAAGVNPAYAASDRAGYANSVPLPVGLLNLVVSDKLQIGNDPGTFDMLAAIDQASYLSSFIFNLPSSPEEIDLENGEDGTVTVAFRGGSRIALSNLTYSSDFALPLHFSVGPVRLGLRPYAFVNGRAVPDTDFEKLFSSGSSGGTVELSAVAEAGVALDIFYASKLPDALLASALEEAGLTGTDVYLGVRGAPYVGLARGDAEGTVSAQLDTGNLSGSYTLEGSAFVSALGVSGAGYGFVADLGAAADVPVDGGTVSFGLGIRNLGVGLWSGQSYSVFDDSSDDEDFALSDPVPDTRTVVAPNFGVVVNGAYTLESSLPFESLTFAGDLGFGAGGLATHLGAEGVFALPGTALAARAGLGYDDGFILGLGGGVSFGGVSLDLALTSHTAPFTHHSSFGVAASLGF